MVHISAVSNAYLYIESSKKISYISSNKKKKYLILNVHFQSKNILLEYLNENRNTRTHALSRL